MRTSTTRVDGHVQLAMAVARRRSTFLQGRAEPHAASLELGEERSSEVGGDELLGLPSSERRDDEPALRPALRRVVPEFHVQWPALHFATDHRDGSGAL